MILISVMIMVMLEHENDITTNSSPINLILGVKVRLVRVARSHNAAIGGRSVHKL